MNKFMLAFLFLVGIGLGVIASKVATSHEVYFPDSKSDSPMEDERVVLYMQNWTVEKDGTPKLAEMQFFTKGWEECQAISEALMGDPNEQINDFLCIRADAWAKAGHDLPTEYFPTKSLTLPDVAPIPEKITPPEDAI